MQDASFEMFCFNILSFKLHYFRILNQLSAWYMELVRIIILLGSEITEPNINSKEKQQKQNWDSFKKLLIQYMMIIEAQNDELIITENFYYIYIHCWFVRKKMGLGP